MEETANRNREMTAVSKRIHAIQAHSKKKMVLFINLLGKEYTEEMIGNWGSI